VTVLIRTYQSARTLPFAIASVLAQTAADLECLIVDDGSTDDTADVVASFADPRIRYIKHPSNLGRATARRTGLLQAEGEFVSFVDADDWWYPQKLERQLALLRAEPELAAVSCGTMLLDEHGVVLGVERADAAEPKLIRLPPMRVPGPTLLPNPPTLFRMENIRGVPTDLTLPRSEDFDFMLGALLGRVSGVWAEPLYAYTLPSTTRYRVHLESAEATRRVYARYFTRYPLVSALRQGECLLKEAAYRVSGKLSSRPQPLRQRGRPPSARELATLAEAKAEIERVLAQRNPSAA
jgi:glycosyltransferase involved in cell wall biosynthesis